jgi:WD40 repeat protein
MTMFALSRLRPSAVALILSALLPGLSAAQADGQKKRALLVGVKQYQHAALDALKYTENDAAELAPVLRDAGFQVTLLCDSEGAKDAKKQPTRTNIDRELKAILQGVGRDDVVLVGLAGHGLQPDGAAESYFCPADANPSIDRGDGNALAQARFPDTLVSVRGLLKDLDDSGAGRRFLLVDACRNDPGTRGRGVADLLGYSGETGVLLSCSKGQRSFEPDDLKHGLFFYYVIEGFKGGAKDPETNEVTWDDLCKYARRQVSRKVPKAIKDAGGSQTPQDFGSRTGEPFVLVKLPGTPPSPPPTVERPRPMPKQSGRKDPQTKRFDYADIAYDGLKVAVGTSNGKATRVYDLSSGKPITPVLGGDDEPQYSPIFSPGATRVLTRGSDNTARLWDAKTGAAAARPLLHEKSVRHAAFSPDGARIVTVSEDYTFRVWDARSGAAITPPLKDKDSFSSTNRAAFSPDGTRVVTFGHSSDGARVWDVKTGAAVTPSLKHYNGIAPEYATRWEYVWDAAFSTDGTRLVTSGNDGARVWEIQSGAELKRLETTPYGTRRAAFNPDGTRLVTVDSSEVRVRDAKTFEPVTPTLKHDGDVYFFAFSPDGARILTGFSVSETPNNSNSSRFKEATVQVWDAESGKRVAGPMKHDSDLLAVSFNADGTRVVTVTKDGTARVWDAKTGTESSKVELKPD